MELKKFKVEIEFTEDLLGSCPSDPEVYKRFIAEKIREETEKVGEEVETLPAAEKEKGGWTVFHQDEAGVFLFDYVVRGYFKEAADALTGNKSQGGISSVKSKIDRWMFVAPRKLYLKSSNGTVIAEQGQPLERPLRAMTMQGPRVSVARSNSQQVGTRLEFELKILPLGQNVFTEKLLREWLEYGELHGIGQWRTGGYGKFKVVAFEAV